MILSEFNDVNPTANTSYNLGKNLFIQVGLRYDKKPRKLLVNILAFGSCPIISI